MPTYWSPRRTADELRREFDRILDSAWPQQRFGRTPFFLPRAHDSALPPVNVYAGDTSYRVEALTPGLDPDSLEVTVTGSELTLSGSRRTADKLKESTCHRSERPVGKFSRTLNLTADIQTDAVSADYRDGIVTITLPKAEKVRPRSIPVSAT